MPATPAPIWRRVMAGFYDGLLLLALWMTGTLVGAAIQDLLQLPGDARWLHLLRVYFFVVGLLFFGWCWTHGGQTPGLKVWRLRLLRDDGTRLRWPVAAVRYTVMLLCWAIVLCPLLALIPVLHRQYPLLEPVAWACLGLTGAGLLSSLADARRRSPQDRCTSTFAILLRDPPATAMDAASVQRVRCSASQPASANSTVGKAAASGGDQP